MKYSTTQTALRALDAVLDPAFNVFTLRMASRINYAVVSHEPYANFEEMRADYARTGLLLVTSRFDGGSIYGDPAVNHAARAWHDMAHILTGSQFDAEGEARAATYQCFEVRRERRNGYITEEQESWFCRILDVEVNGNVRHLLETGNFPENGFKFAVQELF
jgi:hypothetical protein